MFIGSVFAGIYPFVDDARVAIAILWVVLGAGAVYFPILIGTMLNTVKPEMRPKANSIANFAYNMFGFAPAPTVYGLVADLTGGRSSRWGMVFCLYWGWNSFIFSMCVYF